MDETLARMVASEYERIGNFSVTKYKERNYIWKELFIWGRKAESLALRDVLGFGRVSYKKGSIRGGYRWSCNSKNDILRFIKIVLPYLNNEEKAKGLRLLRSLCINIRGRGKRWTENEARIIERIISDIKEMKRKIPSND
jgi:hypothetical protein